MSTFSGIQLRTLLLNNPHGTKPQLVEAVAAYFPDAFATRLPRLRRPWMSEDGRMDVFEAAALAVALRMTGR